MSVNMDPSGMKIRVPGVSVEMSPTGMNIAVPGMNVKMSALGIKIEEEQEVNWATQFLSSVENLSEQPRDLSFWAWHPIGRGLGTAVFLKVFNPMIGLPMPFRAGFVYGMISGATNALCHPLAERVIRNTPSEMQMMSYFFVCTAPWVAAYKIMQNKFAHASRPFLYMTPGAAITAAVAVQVLGYANSDLLNKSV